MALCPRPHYRRYVEVSTLKEQGTLGNTCILSIFFIFQNCVIPTCSYMSYTHPPTPLLNLFHAALPHYPVNVMISAAHERRHGT